MCVCLILPAALSHMSCITCQANSKSHFSAAAIVWSPHVPTPASDSDPSGSGGLLFF